MQESHHNKIRTGCVAYKIVAYGYDYQPGVLVVGIFFVIALAEWALPVWLLFLSET